MKHDKKPVVDNFEKLFDDKFTCTISYTKWPDENEPQKHNTIYRWTDEARDYPKIVKSFILSLVQQEIEKNIWDYAKELCDGFDLVGIHRCSAGHCGHCGNCDAMSDILKNIKHLGLLPEEN